MKLLEFTKVGLIVNALISGPLRYKDLKKTTGLSDAWLSRKIRELLKLELIAQEDGYYHLNPEKVHELLTNEKIVIAKLIAYEVAREKDVLAVILFGSLARHRHVEADIDLLIITFEKRLSPLELSLKIFRKYGIATDIVHLTFRDLLKWFFEKPPLLFGILSGYEILFDRASFKNFFKLLEKDVLKEWAYIKEKELWVKKELLRRM